MSLSFRLDRPTTNDPSRFGGQEGAFRRVPRTPVRASRVPRHAKGPGRSDPAEPLHVEPGEAQARRATPSAFAAAATAAETAVATRSSNGEGIT